jgi:hypothetical protein
MAESDQTTRHVVRRRQPAVRIALRRNRDELFVVGNLSQRRGARDTRRRGAWVLSDGIGQRSGQRPYYNVDQNGGALHRQPRGEKQMAISVRCIGE